MPEARLRGIAPCKASFFPCTVNTFDTGAIAFRLASYLPDLTPLVILSIAAVLTLLGLYALSCAGRPLFEIATSVLCLLIGFAFLPGLRKQEHRCMV